ncbi:MAG: prepilin-type N-terminal cleavage/methylation domain-containing protein [Muribaculaceae bacterium]|nr:prepilin-type N-terminal cleavage/methylation domain-containing protein [Muribaculaceae bacterium]
MKKNGYTLAETLLTIGIIGIVAAITIPILNNSVQKKVLPVQLKVFYADFTNAIRRYMTDNDYTLISDTPFGNKTSSEEEKIEYFVANVLVPYIAGSKTNTTTLHRYLGKEDTINRQIKWNYVSNKGYLISISNGMWDSYITIVFDINGTKGPNKGGYDIFRFYLYDSQTPKQAYQRSADWDCSTCGDSCRPDIHKYGASGYGCWARIMKENYKINY